MSKLLITIDYCPDVGGVARYLKGWRKKHGADALAPKFAEAREGIIRKNLLWSIPPKWLPLLFWTLVYAKKYDELIISHLLPAGYAAFLSRKPYTVILHGLDIILAAKNPWKKYWAKKILDRAKKIIVNSRATGELLRIFFDDLYNYEIEYPAIEPLAPPKKDLRMEYGLAEKKIILSFSRLIKRKGQEKIIRLLPKILQKIPEAIFIIAGNGPERAELEAMAKTFHVSEQVLFLGKIKETELADIYNMCDVFTAPSLPSKDDWEGFGIVCLEAAYLGKPVIVTNVGGLPEAVEDEKTGFVVKDDEELAEKIIMLLKDSEMAEKMGILGKERVINNFLI